ncbi:nucleotide-binding protein [Anaerocolumna jejuensis]|uniref:nucleotide-binding protein n=1 Tax=Anaerocolumna jejuensis TaxID=259063 RepID=UPI003F7B8A33
MRNIAIYGKGGIGKSTISCNITAALGKKNYKVLQIGCDPKHDSTFLLTNIIDNVLLEKFRENSDLQLDDIITIGKYNVNCIELGGPEPGIGCAGRGIIKGLEIINKLEVIEKGNYDFVTYDILGDVVCGGFFEPLKNGDSKDMYIVTSGEFNSLFAANNLCKGYVNNASINNNVKLMGIIGNCRGVKNEALILEEFCNAVGLPLIASIPKDTRIEACCEKNLPIIEAYPESDLAKLFYDLSDILITGADNKYNITPLGFEELRTLYSKSYNY